MIFNTLMILSGIFGLYQLTRITNNFARIILAGQIIAIGLTFIPIPSVRSTGFVLFLLLALAAIIYGLTNKKSLTLIITAPIFLALLFESNNWPFTGLLAWIMVLPIVAYVFIILKDLKRYKNELGFLTILVANAIIKLSIQFGAMIN